MQLSDYTTVKPDKLVIASRGSRLAMWQAEHVRSLLLDKGLDCEILEVKTKGDRIQDRFLHEIGGKGVFVREVEQALLEGMADLAVHSLKDLPAETPEAFALSGILPRHDPGDVLILHPGRQDLFSGKTVLGAADIKSAGSISVATGSLRRGCLLKEASGQIQVVPIRGNVDTRINKLKGSSWDAMILAAASLERLPGLTRELQTLQLDPEWFVPSPSQGALVIETRKEHPLIPVLGELSCPRSRLRVDLERGVLRALGGDCTMPVGVHASFSRDERTLGVSAVVADRDGTAARASLKFAADHLPSPGEMVRKVLEDLEGSGLLKVMKALNLELPGQERSPDC